MYNPENSKEQIAHMLQKLQQLLPEQLNEVEDFIDFLKQKKAKQTFKKEEIQELFDFPVDHVGNWPEDLNLSRQDIYDNDGR